MGVRNVHEREYDASTEVVGSLIDSLASPNDRLWPLEKWPPMRFDKALSLGARGGHGPIRYYAEHYVQSRSVTFRFLAPRGFDGTHSFEVEDADGRTVLGMCSTWNPAAGLGLAGSLSSDRCTTRCWKTA